jgi:hypothetical protein
MKLTAHQAQTVELKARPGMTWAMIAKEMGCGSSSVISSHKLALKKLARQANGDKISPRSIPGDPAVPTGALRAHMAKIAKIGPMSDKDAVCELGKARDAILWHINNTPGLLASAPLRELVSAANMTIEKMQLLQGEPTAITRFQDIRKLDEVAEMLNSELKRRGKLIDVTPEEV